MRSGHQRARRATVTGDLSYQGFSGARRQRRIDVAEHGPLAVDELHRTVDGVAEEHHPRDSIAGDEHRASRGVTGSRYRVDPRHRDARTGERGDSVRHHREPSRSHLGAHPGGRGVGEVRDIIRVHMDRGPRKEHGTIDSEPSGVVVVEVGEKHIGHVSRFDTVSSQRFRQSAVRQEPVADGSVSGIDEHDSIAERPTAHEKGTDTEPQPVLLEQLRMARPVVRVDPTSPFPLEPGVVRSGQDFTVDESDDLHPSCPTHDRPRYARPTTAWRRFCESDVMPTGLDFLAIVSRPSLPSGTGPVGDYYGLHDFVARHPEWRCLVLELNHLPVEIEWDDDGLRLIVPGHDPVHVKEITLALFLPVCLEIEETQLAAIDPAEPWPRFAAENWRPVSAYFESVLDRQHCLNRPSAVRTTNNKLLQFDALRGAGFDLPRTTVRRGFPSSGPLSALPALVTKNVSEGGWKSPTEFSPARLADAPDGLPQPIGVEGEPWPTIWQEPITSDRELRIYVMGDAVIAIELTRDPQVLDVRDTNEGRPHAVIIDLRNDWRDIAIEMTRALGLDYAVLDAIPVGETLHVLEVNANGVWWFLPPPIGATLQEHFHGWLEAAVHVAMRA